MREVALENAGLIVGVVVPIVLVLRWPWLAATALRLLIRAPAVLLGEMLRSGFRLNPAVVWRMLVSAARSKRERLLRKRAQHRTANTKPGATSGSNSRRNRQQRRS